MDGWVTVGTKLDTKQLEKDLKDSERRLQQYEKEAERLTKTKAKAELDLSAYHEAKRNIQQMTDEALQLAQTEGEVNTQLRLEQTQLEELNAKYSKQLGALDDVNKKIEENAKNQGLLNNEISEMNQKLRQTKGLDGVKESIDGVSDSVSKTIRNVAKWGLAVFGVRSAYMFVRQSASTLAQYNEQIASDLEYMNFALASMLKPVIEALIQLAYKLLVYINYIAQAWFGVNLFANASADAMNKTTNSAKELRKTLAGFDEMNLVGGGVSSASGGGVTLPSIDLSAPEDVPIPSWLQWIVDNKDDVLATIGGIGAGLLGMKGGLSLIQGFGVAIASTGIIKFFQDLDYYINKVDSSLDDNGTSMEDFGKIVSDVGIIVLGLGIAFGGLPAIIGGVITILTGIMIQFSDDIQQIFQNEIYQPLEEAALDLEERGWWGKSLSSALKELIQFSKDSQNIGWGIFYEIKDIFDGILLIFKGDFSGGIYSIARGLCNSVIRVINTVITALNTTTFAARKLAEGAKNLAISIASKFGLKYEQWQLDFMDFFTKPIPTISPLATGGIVNMPGRGVPIGGAIAGEVSKEGVIPLTDSQAMTELGATIGKYITINASITNTMNGRVISRELQKINANSDFATNS